MCHRSQTATHDCMPQHLHLGPGFREQTRQAATVQSPPHCTELQHYYGAVQCCCCCCTTLTLCLEDTQASTTKSSNTQNSNRYTSNHTSTTSCMQHFNPSLVQTQTAYRQVQNLRWPRAHLRKNHQTFRPQHMYGLAPATVCTECMHLDLWSPDGISYDKFNSNSYPTPGPSASCLQCSIPSPYPVHARTE
jgi:hypothetical protein